MTDQLHQHQHQHINLANVEAFALDPTLADQQPLFAFTGVDQHRHDQNIIDNHDLLDQDGTGNGDGQVDGMAGINDTSQDDIDAAIKATLDGTQSSAHDGLDPNDPLPLLSDIDPSLHPSASTSNNSIGVNHQPQRLHQLTQVNLDGPGIEAPHLLRPPERNEDTPHPESLEFRFRVEFEAWLKTESHWCHYVQRRITNPEKRAEERLRARIKAHEATLDGECVDLLNMPIHRSLSICLTPSGLR